MRYNILLLGSDSDSDRLDRIINPYANLARAASARDALAEVNSGIYDVVLCPWDVPDASWRTVLEQLHRRRPEIPVIVFHHCGCEQEWLEVLEAGAFDLLCPPYEEGPVMARIEHAVASRYASDVAGAGAGRTGTAMAGRR